MIDQIREGKPTKQMVQFLHLTHVVAIVDFYQNVQLSSHKKDQPGKAYSFVPLNIHVLGIVYCNSEKEHLHAYMYTEVEERKGSNTVTSLIMKYLFKHGLLDEMK